MIGEYDAADAAPRVGQVLDRPGRDTVVHLTVGETLEIRLDEHAGATWRLDLRPRGLTLETDGAEEADLRVWRFRAEFGVGGFLRLELVGADDRAPLEIVDVCVTVS